MKLDIIAITDNSKSIWLYDYTNILEYPEVFRWELNIRSSKIPNGRISNTIDLMNYLRTLRVEQELFIIRPETLGFASSSTIPDGVYYLDYTLNNESRTITFIMFQTVKDAVSKLLKDNLYKIEVGNYDIEYAGDTSTNDIEHIRMCAYLLDVLYDAGIKKDDVLANDTLLKLQRLLGILT